MIIADFLKTTPIKLKIRFRGKILRPKIFDPYRVILQRYYVTLLLRFVLRNRVLRNLTHSFEFQSHSLATPSGG